MASPSQQILKNIGKLNYEFNPTSSTYQSRRANITKMPVMIKENFDNINTKIGNIDLNSLLIKNPNSTFLIKVTGNSMINAGINTGDIILVDRSLEAESGNIIVATINDELLVKRLLINNKIKTLISENDLFPNIIVKEKDRFTIWGVVKSIIRQI